MKTYYMHTREGRPAFVQFIGGLAYMPMFGIKQINIERHCCASLKKLRAEQELVLLGHDASSINAEDLGYVRLVLP